MKIHSIDAWQIFDSRGNPTVEAEVLLEGGVTGRGMVPSGASTGQFEALELRDKVPEKFRGRSVLRAVENIRQEVASRLCGMEADDQAAIDAELITLDGTPDKSRLGANAILAVSMAVASAVAVARGIPLFRSLGDGTLLPLPEIQIFGGGAHADWRTDVQDFLVMATGARTYEETLEMTFHVFHTAGDLMKERGSRYGVADEGGYWPEFRSNEEALEMVVRAIERAGYTPGREMSISLDIAASDLLDPRTGLYHFRLEDRRYDSEEFSELIVGWCDKYPIVSIEDPLADTDTEGWKGLAATLGTKIQLVGDDLFTTNTKRIQQGIDNRLANAALIKLNQIGTVSETLEAIRLTQNAGWAPIISARSGETEDAFIAHLAVATNAGQLKVGSFSRSERMAKWNEILRIQRALGSEARFVGAQAILPPAGGSCGAHSACSPQS